MRKIMQIYSGDGVAARHTPMMVLFLFVFSDKGSNGINPHTEYAGLELASVEYINYGRTGLFLEICNG